MNNTPPSPPPPPQTQHIPPIPPMPPQGMATLIVSRRTSYVAMAMPVKILLNGREIGRVNVGGRLETTIPANDCTLMLDMVGNSMNIHPIRQQIVLSPSQSKKGVITVDFGIKANALGILTSGLCKKIGEIQADVKYL